MASQNKIIEMIASIKTIYPYYAKETDVEVLVKTWTVLLKDYPDDVVEAAFYKCLQTCKMPPTPADVIENIESIIAVNEPSDEQLWNEYVKAIKDVEREAFYILYPKFGEDHRQNIQNVWDNLSEKIKAYIGSQSELLRTAKTYTDEDLKFEKNRFLKAMPNFKIKADFLALAEKRNLMIEG